MPLLVHTRNPMLDAYRYEPLGVNGSMSMLRRARSRSALSCQIDRAEMRRIIEEKEVAAVAVVVVAVSKLYELVGGKLKQLKLTN